MLSLYLNKNPKKTTNDRVVKKIYDNVKNKLKMVIYLFILYSLFKNKQKSLLCPALWEQSPSNTITQCIHLAAYRYICNQKNKILSTTTNANKITFFLQTQTTNKLFKKKRALKPPRTKLSKLNYTWRFVKRFIKTTRKKRIIKNPVRACRINEKENFNKKFYVKYKPNSRIYRIVRKKVRAQLVKQQVNWSYGRNKIQKNGVIETKDPTIFNRAHMRKFYTKLLLLIYRKKRKPKKTSKLTTKYKKTRHLFKNIYNNKSTKTTFKDITIKKPTTIHHSSLYHNNYNIPKIKDLMTISKMWLLTPLIAQNTRRITHEILKNPRLFLLTRSADATLKEAMFRSIFSFYKSNFLINDLLTYNYIDKNYLLKLNLGRTPKNIEIINDVIILNKAKSITEYINIDSLPLNYLNKSINNFYPLIYFTPNKSKTTNNYRGLFYKLYYSQIGKLTFSKYKNFYMYFLLNFLETFLKKKIWIRTDCQDFFNSFLKRYIEHSLRVNANTHRRFIRLINIHELLEIIIIMYISRDLQIFLYFLKKCFEQSHFKKHKKILSILFDILRKHKELLKYTSVKGFCFDIRGKVGVSGNAKKRHVFFSLGKITNTTQNVRSYWQQTTVWTPTGQMGITCYLLYN